MKRDVYSKLMKLQSSGADALLEDKFNSIDKAIRAAKDNDTIYEQLEALEQFVYKVNDKAVGLLGYVLKMKPLEPTKHSTQYGDIEGKEFGDLLTKSLELTNRIRYYQTPKILEIYFWLFKKGAEKRLEDKLRDLARYDLEALKYIGYRAQNDIIAFLEKKKNDKRYLDFMVQLVEHMATAEGEHHGMKDENTITFGFAPLPVNDDLKKIRAWMIDELSRLLNEKEVSVTHKLKTIDLLQSLTHGPHRGEASEALNDLIDENALTVLAIYKKLLVSSKGVLRAPLPLAIDIEERLYYMKRGRSETIKEAVSSLLSIVRKDKAYNIYIALVGDRLEYRTTEGSFDEKRDRAQERRNKLVQEFPANATLLCVIDHVATYSADIEDWKLNTFNYFLEQLAESKPKPAYELVDESFKAKKPLTKFVGYFLTGFRKAKAAQQYDETLHLIISNKVVEALPNVAYSLKDSEWTEDDIKIAKELMDGSGHFKFIKKKEWPNYLYALTTSLVCSVETEPPKITNLLIELINKYEKYSNVYFGAIDMATHRDKVEVGKFDDKLKAALLNNLVAFDRLEHDHQDLLYEITDKDATKVIDFFTARIHRYTQKNTRTRDDFKYDAVPYHLNDNLRDLLKNDPNYAATFKKILDSFTGKWSYYNSEMGQLLKRTGNYKQPMLEYIQAANKTDLRKALDFFATNIDGIDLEIAFAIVAKTDDKKVWTSVRTGLYNTGVVSGEYGLANAHQARHDAIKKKFASSDNKRVKQFAKETMAWLKKLVEQEKRRTDEELRLRKIDFEH